MTLGPQFDAYQALRSVPAPFGTTPIPEDHVRVNHYTSDESVPGIRQHGLSMSKAHESYASGGTEFPSIFATAGQPRESLLRSRPVVEAHIPVNMLDIGRWDSPQQLESHQSVVTTNQDVPASQIISVHEPWHQTLRYIQENPSMEKDIMGGMFENSGDEDADKAIQASKLALASKVMLGGALGSHK